MALPVRYFRGMANLYLEGEPIRICTILIKQNAPDGMCPTLEKTDTTCSRAQFTKAKETK